MHSTETSLETAITLHRDGRLREAEVVYRQLLAHVSQATQANAALAVLLSSQGRFAEARRHYESVIAQTPQDFLAHKLLADACSEDGDVEAASQHYREAAHRRNNDWLWHLRADIVTPTVFRSNAAIDEYRACLAANLERYRNAPPTLDLDELVDSGCKPPLALAYQGRDDCPIKELFASIFADRLPADLPRAGVGKPHVGFVVTEGNEGVFARGMAGVIRHLDPKLLRTTIVCAPSAIDKLRKAIGREIDLLPLVARLSETVDAIRTARFDLLYYWEIGTDCTNYYLPFFRLAPVQCASWGWPVTSGIAEVDYFLSSEWLEPPDAESHYTEKLVRLRHIPNYYDLPRVPETNIQAIRGQFPQWRRLYFCAQNPRKLHPDFDSLVGRILRCDDNGALLLVESAKPAVTRALKQRLERSLPDCIDRIHWLPRMTQGVYWSWLAAADCVLDTPHYCGGANSTYDAFAAGAPIVTLTGPFHRGRYTTAAYNIMDLPDCIAATADQYVDIALRLAAESDFKGHVRKQILERRHMLFDNRSAVQELQAWFLNTISRISG